MIKHTIIKSYRQQKFYFGPKLPNRALRSFSINPQKSKMISFQFPRTACAASFFSSKTLLSFKKISNSHESTLWRNMQAQKTISINISKPQNQKKKVKMSSSSHNSSRFPFQKSDEEWKNILSAEQYRVLRQKGTERAGTGEYDKKVSPLKKKKRKMQVERGQKEKKILISGQNKFLSTTVSLCVSVSLSLF